MPARLVFLVGTTSRSSWRRWKEKRFGEALRRSRFQLSGRVSRYGVSISIEHESSPACLQFFLIDFPFQALSTCDRTWPNISRWISSATFCASQTSAMPAAASRSPSQTTESGRCATSHAVTSSAATRRSSHAPPRSRDRPSTGRSIWRRVRRSTCAPLAANASRTYQSRRMRSTSTRTSRGARTRCSRWSSAPTRTGGTRCTPATTSKFQEVPNWWNFYDFRKFSDI